MWNKFYTVAGGLHLESSNTLLRPILARTEKLVNDYSSCFESSMPRNFALAKSSSARSGLESF